MDNNPMKFEYCGPKLMALKLCSGNCFQFKGYNDLDLATPKSIGVFYPYEQSSYEF
jgi:hypothetical protein